MGGPEISGSAGDPFDHHLTSHWADTEDLDDDFDDDGEEAFSIDQADARAPALALLAPRDDDASGRPHPSVRRFHPTDPTLAARPRGPPRH